MSVSTSNIRYVLRTKDGSRYYTGGLVTESTDITRARVFEGRIPMHDQEYHEICILMPDDITVVPLLDNHSMDNP